MRENSNVEYGPNQVQAIGMYGAAQPDFFKSETNGGIKNIISYHLKTIKNMFSHQIWRLLLKKQACHALEKFQMVKGVAAPFFKLYPSKFVKS